MRGIHRYCEICGKMITGSRSDAMTCSQKCRKAKSRQKSRLAAPKVTGIPVTNSAPATCDLPSAAQTAQSVTVPEPKSAAERIRDALSLPCAYCQKLPRANGWAICEPCHQRSELNFWAYQAYKDTSQRFNHYFRVSN